MKSHFSIAISMSILISWAGIFQVGVREDLFTLVAGKGGY